MATKIVAADKALRKSLAPTDRDLPFLDFRQYPFAGAEALDPHTLRIRVKGKYPQFKYWLAMTFFAPIPWEAEKFYAQPGMAEKNLTLNFWPVGTGPFMQTEYIENRRHVIERNPNFRGEPYPCEGEPGDKEKGYLADCGKMIPFVDKVVFDLEKEGVPLQAKFIQGYYDSPAIERLDYGTAMIVAMGDDKKKEKEYRDKGVKLPTTIEANNWYIGFNWLDPVVGKGDTPAQAERNRKLRQALSIAIDWEEHIAIFERGQGVAAQGPLPPSLFGYREDGPSAFNPVVYTRRVPTASRCAARSRRRRSFSQRRAIPTGATRRPASRWCSTSTISPRPRPASRRCSTGTRNSSRRSACRWRCAPPTTTGSRTR